jgi:sulfur carrier protein ThiS
MVACWRILGSDWKEIEPGRSIDELLREENLSPEEYVPSVNGKVVTTDYILKEGDELTLVPVVSGG